MEARVTPSVTFAPQATFTVGSGPFAVAVADFNGDGRPDLAVLNNGTVSVLLNTTPAGAVAPSFALQQTFTVGNNPLSVAVGDFNGDGRPDLAVLNNGTVSVLLNTTPAGAAAPSFAPQQTFTVGNGPFSVAVGDFNGDGRPDIVVTNVNASQGTVSVLLNTTAAGAAVPSFAAQKAFNIGHGTFNSVAVGDFNGDGRPDVVASNFSDDTLSVLLNTTEAGAAVPSFAPQQTFTAGNGPGILAVADFNGDGKPDLVFAQIKIGTTAVSVLLNTTPAGASAPSFAPEQTFAVGNGPVSVAVGDFNGDGRPDIAAPVVNDDAVSVLLNTTSAGATVPSFAAPVTFAVGAFPVSVAVGDFNGDGRSDLAVVNGNDNTASVLLNSTAPFATTTPVVVADLHGMGVVEYNRFTKSWVQLNPGNPSDVSLLAADAAGYVAADYAGYGVFRYSPVTGVWTNVNGVDAAALAIDAADDVFASFARFGIGEFPLLGGGRQIGPSTASMLAADANGDVVGEFQGYGVWRYTPLAGTWRRINGVDAVALAVNPSGDVVVSFQGFGVGEYAPGATVGTNLTTSNAQAVAIDTNGDVTLSIAGTGVEEYLPSVGLVPQYPNVASLLAMDANGDIYGDFTTFGVYEFDPYLGWHPLSGNDVTRLVVA